MPTELAVSTRHIPALAADLSVNAYLTAQLAPATRSAYRSDARIFSSWCAARKVAPIPAAPETVAAFLASEADHGVKANTLRRRIAAIKFLHQSAGLESPTSSMVVTGTTKGILRTIGTAVTRKAPATAPRVHGMIQHCRDTL